MNVIQYLGMILKGMRIDVYKRGMTALQFRLSNPNLIFKASSQFKDSIKVSTINYRRGVHR